MAIRLDSVDNLKAYLRFPPTESLYDTLLGSLVEDISAECQKYTGRVFLMTTYLNDIYRSKFTDTITLRQYPTNPSQPVNLSIYNGVDQFLVAANDFVVDYDRGIIRLRPGIVFPEEPDGASVTHTAGYADNNLGGTAEAIQVPLDLARSVRRLCAAEFRNSQGALKEDGLEKVRTNVQKAVWESYARQW